MLYGKRFIKMVYGALNPESKDTHRTRDYGDFFDLFLGH
jgi:hypothetical protein